MLDVLAGHESYSYNYDNLYAFKTTEVFEGKTNLSNFTEMNTLTGYETNYKTESYLGRVRYNYADKYNLEVSFRLMVHLVSTKTIVGVILVALVPTGLSQKKNS